MLDQTNVSLNDFMSRFGEEFFDKAIERTQPEYTGGRPELDARVIKKQFERVPFPAQSEAVKALYVHLYEQHAKMAFAVGEMGVGKTTIASMLSAMPAHHQRVLVTVPPHLVGKWAREIKEIIPWAKVTKINSGSANRILDQAAKANPGRPKQLEFYVIGRVRLRMDYRIESALVRRRGGVCHYHCPDCGHRPVKEIPMKDDAKLPPEAIVLDLDDEEDTSDHFYLNLTPSDITRGKTCEKVFTSDGEVVEGCGAALWQAKRNVQYTREQLLIKAFQKLPGVGKGLAERLANHDDAWKAAEMLEDGDIPQLLWNILGPVRRKRLKAWMQNNEFALDSSDYSPARFIHKRLPHKWFDLAIFDEVHELKAQGSAQGLAYGVVAGVVNKVLCLTGTLVDGYAANLHPLLFRADPKRMLEFGYGASDTARFQWELGVVKEIRTETITTSHRSSRARKKVRRQKRNLPGLHPKVVTDLLLPNAIFVTLADIEKSIQSLQEPHETPVRLLPSYREVYVAPYMDPQQADSVKRVTNELMNVLKKALAQDYGQGMLGPIISTLLRYPDDCFRPLYLKLRSGEVLADEEAVPVPQGQYLPKVRVLQDLVKREMAEGRRVVVYTTYTDRRDLSHHYAEALRSIGADARVLKSSVPTDQRELWIEEQVRDGCDVIVCNPELVKTGLDLFDFPTMWFCQTGYVTDTILQAARRSWRIGQMQPVRVYFAGYADSEAQKQALSLMAKKIRVANRAKGDIADSGLSVLDDDDEATAMQAMANAILDKRRDRTHDTITGAITSIGEDDCSQEFTADSIKTLHEVIAKANRRKRGIVYIEDKKIEKANKPTPKPAEENDQSETLLIAQKTARRRRKEPPKAVAANEVPAGAQLALF